MVAVVSTLDGSAVVHDSGTFPKIFGCSFRFQKIWRGNRRNVWHVRVNIFDPGNLVRCYYLDSAGDFVWVIGSEYYGGTLANNMELTKNA